MTRFLRRHLATAAGLVLLGAAAFTLAPGAPRAAEAPAEPAPRLLSAVGRATVEARPDAARVSFGVSHLAPAAATAYGQVAETSQRIIAALREQGVAEAEIQTTGLSLQPEYQYDKEGVQHLRGYRATNNLTVTTRNLAAVGSLVDTAVAAGANSVGGIAFFAWDSAALVQEALDRAVDDARSKAERVAGRLGAAIAGVQRISVMDEVGGGPPPVPFERAAAPMLAPMPVLGGTIRFQVSVSADFILR